MSNLFSFVMVPKVYHLCISVLKTAVLVVIGKRGFRKWIVMHQLQFMTNFKFLFLTPRQKPVTISGHSKFRKKNFISENYNVQSAFVPNLMNVFCHHQKRPISGLRWVDCKSGSCEPALIKFIGCIRNVRIASFFNVYLYNALFEFLSSCSINQKLDINLCE